MTIKSILYALGLGLAFLIALLVTFLFWKAAHQNPGVPKDQELLKIFQNHREEFVTLEKMVLEDSANDSYFSEVTLDKSHLSEVRRNEYKHLLDTIWPSLIVRVGYEDQVTFSFASGGDSAIGPGWMKGIAYVPEDHKKDGVIESNLDEMINAPPNVYLKPIEPKWFLLYQRDD